MYNQKRVVITEDPYNQPDKETAMEFRLTYRGPLLSAQARNTQAEHKHALRRAFHFQLKRLWEITPFLDTGERSGPSALLLEGREYMPLYDRDSLAAKHAQFGFNFVPLVTRELNLLCGLEILFLRPDKPGNLWRGDIDNRIKTLFDALRIPEADDYYTQRKPASDEKPFYCLLEDDDLITKISVETDQLLAFDGDNENIGNVALVITVRLRPYETTLGNMAFS